jgi:hypothetical protein
MNCRILQPFLLAGVWLLMVQPVWAKIQVPEKRIYTTMKIHGQSPVIDGHTGESAWSRVEWSGAFTQREPHDGQEPTYQTAFKILYDEENLYIAIRAYDEQPDRIVRRMSRRDGFEGDWVEVNIDSYFDKRTAFSFTASVSGVKGDEAITNNGDQWDATWDPIWYLKTSIDEQGWVAEMRIPFTQLRFNNNPKQVWGLQFTRRLFRKEELSNWQYIPQKEAGWVHHFGELRGIQGIQPKKQMELSPYLVSKIDRYRREAGNPFSDGSDFGYDVGMDGKIGVTNDLTLDFTINPDFGQVEADPSEVNLSAFETYFQEKRPFFIEGKNITHYQFTSGGNAFSSDNLFYSRRIGRAPQYSPDLDDDEYARIPERTRILGAAKITGKTKNGWSVGVLESVTAREKADLFRQGVKSTQVAEPWTNYFLGRVQKDINKGNTIIGGMFTSTNRFHLDEELDFLSKQAYTGGIDFKQFWGEKKYYFNLKYSMSHFRGSEDAIQYQQESSRRYFQRPDNDYVNYDTTRHSLTGHGGILEFGKQASSGLRYLAWLTWRSPGFELNDMGYLRQADAIFQVIWAGYRISEPFGIFRQVNFDVNQWTGWDFGGNRNYEGGNVSVWSQFTNHWTFSMGANIEGDGLSNTVLWGGPAARTPGSWNYWVDTGTDSRKKLSLHAWHSNVWGFYDFLRNTAYGVNMEYRPTNSLRLSFTPEYSVTRNILQYMNTEKVNGQDKYIFGRLDQKTLDLTLRIDYTLSPELTIQYYGAPFVSGVDYSKPKQITNPRADKLRNRYSFDVSFSDEDYVKDYDFNFKQFRSNLVMRWEYKPGSLLYLVWSQGRTGSAETGKFSYRQDLKRLYRIYPENIFLVKLSYCIIP